MATYRAVASDEFDADSPVTTTLVSALVNNLLAVIEGASGAPRISPSATGYTAISSSAVGTVLITDVSLYGGAVIDVKYINVAPGAAPMTIELSNDGVSFGSAITVANVAGNVDGSATITVDTSSGNVESVYSDGSSAGALSGTATIPGLPVSHMRLTAAGISTTTIAALARVNAGVVA